MNGKIFRVTRWKRINITRLSFRKFGPVLLGFLLLSFKVSAQQDSIRAGIVLSGGGAKGMAHLGVLKVLEEQGIYPRYLTGTSIGAIVGAYYAAGYSPEEILAVFKGMNFEDLLQDQVPRRFLPLYLKKTGRNHFFYFPVDKKNFGIHLPGGLTNYQMFYNRLFRDLFHVQYLSSFDSLPVKVRFYATDLINGKVYEFHRGSLIQAVVASSAFPSVVAPQKIHGKLLTDGGVLNNYPVDEVYRLGATYAIGVDIQGRLYYEDEIKGVPDVLNQITSFYMYEEMPEKIRKTDWYIRPDVTDFSVMDFQHIDTIYRLGVRAALQDSTKISFLKSVIKEDKPIKLRPWRPDSLRFSFIKINCDDRIDEAQVLWQTNFSPMKKISFREFEDGINYLYGTGKYKQIHYWIEPDSTLVLELVRNSTDLRFKFAYQYSPLYKINLLAGLTLRDFYRDKGMLDIEVIFGDPMRYNVNFMIDNGYHFGFGLKSSLHQFVRNVSYPLFFDDVPSPSFNRMDLNFSRFKNGIYFLTMLSTNFNMTIGADIGRYAVYTTVFSGPDDNRKFFLVKDYYFSGYLDLYYDDLDDFYFPTHGVLINFTSTYSQNTAEKSLREGFYNLNFKIKGYRRHTGHFSTSYIFRGGILTHNSDALPFRYFLGGLAHNNVLENLIPFFSRDYIDIKTSSYLMITPQIQKAVQNHYFQLGGQVAAVEEEGPVRFHTLKPYYNVYLRYGLKSFFGPLFITYAFEPNTKKQYVNFTVGFFF